MAKRDAAQNLFPVRLVALVRNVDSAAFAIAIDVPLLLVRTDEESGELAAALDQVFESGGARLDAGMAFRTITEDPTMRAGSARPPASFGPDQLQTRLIRAKHYAVPLRKRAGAGKEFTERISIGRARNNDIVLRNESVSKFHAWIARDEDDHYFVGDASSRNGTSLNGLRLGAHPSSIVVGDVLRFGSIEAVLCSADVLWRALR